MITEELVNELKLIAYAEAAKPVNRVAALSSLARNGIDRDKVRNTLYSIATDIDTPDAVKVRAIDLLDKLEVYTAPKEIKQEQLESLEKTLMEQYVRTAE